MGDEEGESGPVYLYEGDRATGATMEITAGAPPKELTKELQLLGGREGQGKATFPQGDVYEGTFSEGVRAGAGKYTYAAPPPGDDEEPKPPVGEYEGAWKAGQKNGVGVMTYSSGAKYHGHWKNGKYEGNGTLFYPNGDIYTGMWAAGKKHGQGTYIFKATDTKVSGEFSHNVLQSGSFTDAYGNEFAGQFSGSAESVGYVAGGEYKLCSGATQVARNPTAAELAIELAAYDKDKNGVIDKQEFKEILTRPGSGFIAMTEDEAASMLEAITAIFDKNSDGKMQISEVAECLTSQLLM